MARKKTSKQKSKPAEEKEVMDGLNMPFEEVMKILANPPQQKERVESASKK